MLKFKVELDLGNDAMQTVDEVSVALQRALDAFLSDHVTSRGVAAHLVEGDGGVLRDVNGNRVGVWGVEDTRGTDERGVRRESAYDRRERELGRYSG